MPKYFCDYCDVYLTHDSMSVRKAHNSGRNHLRNVIEYYQQIGHEKAQSVIDSITESYAAEGQSAAMPIMNQANQPRGFQGPPMGFPPLPGGRPPFPPGPPGPFPPGGPSPGQGMPPFPPPGMMPPQGMPPMGSPGFKPPFPGAGMPPGPMAFPPPGGFPPGPGFPMGPPQGSPPPRPGFAPPGR